MWFIHECFIEILNVSMSRRTPFSRAPNVSWGVHQSLAHPPTDVGGS